MPEMRNSEKMSMECSFVRQEWSAGRWAPCSKGEGPGENGTMIVQDYDMTASNIKRRQGVARYGLRCLLNEEYLL